MPNQRKYNFWGAVLNLPPDYVLPCLDFLRSGCSLFVEKRQCSYWAIVHDRDVLPDGNFKTEHVHLVFDLANSADHDSLLLDLSASFCCPLNCVSLNKVRFLAGAVRYLTHKDDEDKEPYDDSEVFTNAPDRYRELVSCILSPKAVYEYLSGGGNPIGLILQNGRLWWNSNRNMVNDIVRYLDKERPRKKKGG